MKTFIRKYIILILIGLVIILAGATIYFYKKSTSEDAQVKESIAEAKSLAKKVGRLMIVPEDEIPTVATVSDPEALSDQSFFVGAQKDDKVLIYSNAKKAIVYRPSIQKIINIAPLNVGEDTAKKAVQAPAPVEEESTE